MVFLIILLVFFILFILIFSLYSFYSWYKKRKIRANELISSFIDKNLNVSEKYILIDNKNVFYHNKNFLKTFTEYLNLEKLRSKYLDNKKSYERRAEGYKLLFSFDQAEKCLKEARVCENKANEINSQKNSIIIDIPEYDIQNKNYKFFALERNNFCASIDAELLKSKSFKNIELYYLKIGRAKVIFFPSFYLYIVNLQIKVCDYDSIEILADEEIDTVKGFNGEFYEQRWKYERVNGGPDLRYNNNYSTTYYRHPIIKLNFEGGVEYKTEATSFEDLRKIIYNFNGFKINSKNIRLKIKSSFNNNATLTITNGILSECFLDEENVIIKDDFNEIFSNAFIGLIGVKTITILNQNLTKISENAFTNCPDLEEVNISSNYVINCNKLSFKNCPRLKKINFKKACFSNNFYNDLSDHLTINIDEYHGSIDFSQLKFDENLNLNIKDLFCGTKLLLNFYVNSCINKFHNAEKLLSCKIETNNCSIVEFINDEEVPIQLSFKENPPYSLLCSDKKIIITNYCGFDDAALSMLRHYKIIDLQEYKNTYIDFFFDSYKLEQIILPKDFKGFKNMSLLEHCSSLKRIDGFKPNKYNTAHNSLVLSNNYSYEDSIHKNFSIKRAIIEKYELTKIERDLISHRVNNIYITEEISPDLFNYILKNSSANKIILNYDNSKETYLPTDFSYNIKEIEFASNILIFENKNIFKNSSVSEIIFHSISVVIPDDIFEYAEHLKCVHFDHAPQNYSILVNNYTRIRFTCSEVNKIKYKENVLLSEISYDIDKNSIKSVIVDKDNIKDGQFVNYFNLESVIFTNVIDEIPNDAFSNCFNLKEVIFEKKLPTIFKRGCFNNCFNIIDVNFIAEASTIEEDAFMNCTSIKEINFPYSINKISKNSFRNCFNLKRLFIPGTVTEIEEHAFSNCTNLKHIEGLDKILILGNECFLNSGIDGTIIFPKTLKIYDNAFKDSCMINEIVFSGDLDKFKCEFTDKQESLSLVLPYQIADFSCDDTYKILIKTRRGTNWRKKIRYAKVEYYAPDEFLDLINNHLFSKGYAIIQSNKKVKLERDDNNEYLNELFDTVETDNKDDYSNNRTLEESYDSKLRRQGAFWDTLVVSEANENIEDVKEVIKYFDIKSYNLKFKNIFEEPKEIDNTSISNKTNVIVNQIFNVDLLVKDLSITNIIIIGVNILGEPITDVKEVFINELPQEEIRINLELNNNVGNGYCYILILDKDENVICSHKTNIDRQIVADDDFGIFF